MTTPVCRECGNDDGPHDGLCLCCLDLRSDLTWCVACLVNKRMPGEHVCRECAERIGPWA